jgi:hypothetical protein
MPTSFFGLYRDEGIATADSLFGPSRQQSVRRELVRRADVDALIDGIAGITLTALSSMPARCAPRGDLAIRRSIERVCSRCAQNADVCQQKVDENGERPLDDDV